MSRANKWRMMAGKALDVSPDLVVNIPRITVIGSFQMYVENHQGLVRFTSQQLRLRTEGGELLITGEGLVIRRVLADEVFLEGQISSVQFLQGGSGRRE